MNLTNQTNIDQIFNGLSIFSQIAYYYCLTTHFVYIILIVFIKEFRQKSLIFINHAAIVSILYPIAMLVFQYVSPASFADKQKLIILCSIFEYYWPLSIYMRMFSILLIAIHRYIGVFKPDLFKKINQLTWPLGLFIISAWLTAIGLTLIDKFSFGTTYMVTYCLDGYSSVWEHSLGYALFYVILSMLVPGIAIVIIYVLINRKLKLLAQKTSKRPGTVNRERRYANQFILMCACVVLNICGISVFSVRALVPNFFSVFFYVRPVIRAWIAVMASLVPIISLVYNPYFKIIFSRFKSNSSQNNTSLDFKI